MTRIPALSSLGAKINVVLAAFFLFALSLILLTLNEAHHLQGGAAAINDAGSERMRTNGLAFRLHQVLDGTETPDTARAAARELMQDFEVTLTRLERGDPERPLFLPQEPRIRQQMRELRRMWDGSIRPLAAEILEVRDESSGRRLIREFDGLVQRYVPMINALVLMVERSNASHTYTMSLYQNALVGFSLVGTVFLLMLIHRLVIRPVNRLRSGIERMAASDFSVRLPVVTRDELGQLAGGFNRMAGHLQDLYATLEQRVIEKTRSLEEKNSELALLYDITTHLAEPVTIEAACQTILLKIMDLLGAKGGVMRLVNAAAQELDIVCSQNMSDAFLACEAHLPMGTCLCGSAALNGTSYTCDLAEPPREIVFRGNCTHDGYSSMTAIPIRSKNQVFGIITLFFEESRVLAKHELQLLEAIGQHLGIAIENLRLVVREKEMAVSEERNLLAQELHDSIAQSLAFLNIEAQMLQNSLDSRDVDTAAAELARMREAVQQSYDNVRELLVHFRIKVDHAELDEAIRSALEKFEAQTGISTSFHKSDDGATPGAAHAIQVMHIIQEALSNVRKHAGASRIEVHMQGGKEPMISLTDDGKGFDVGRVVGGDDTHVGLNIMRERAHRIGGSLEIASEPGSGTRITLALAE